MLWAVYLSAFFLYTFTIGHLERDLLRDRSARRRAQGRRGFAAIAFGFWARRKFKVRSFETVSFEAEEPADQMFQGFNLTEIQAAQAVAARGTAER